MKRIVLHIGSAKTGSTYVQKRLRLDESYVRSQGIFLPVLDEVARIAGNAKLLAACLSKERTYNFKRAFPQVDPTVLDPQKLVDRMLADWKPTDETLVLSAEDFRHFHASALKQMLPPDVDVTVVLVIRRQDQWISSIYSQWIKTGSFSDSMPAFLATLDDPNAHRYRLPDWFRDFKVWMQHFGSCQIVFFDEACDDLLGSFLTAAQLPDLPELPQIAPQQVRLSGHQIAYILEAGRHYSGDAYHARRVIARKTPPEEAVNLRLLSNGQLAKIKRDYQPSNENLLAALGRQTDDPLLDIPTTASLGMTLAQVWQSEKYQAYKMQCELLLKATTQ